MLDSLSLEQHFLHYNDLSPQPDLLPDGTDNHHSPGGLWTRRMWAGGSLHLLPRKFYKLKYGLYPEARMGCLEYIKDVQLRGSGEAEKIFVTIERRVTRLDENTGHDRRLRFPTTKAAAEVCKRDVNEPSWGESILKEERRLVFLKDRSPEEVAALLKNAGSVERYLRCVFSSERNVNGLELTRYSTRRPGRLSFLDTHTSNALPLLRVDFQCAPDPSRQRVCP
jgi:hypothetical protein